MNVELSAEAAADVSEIQEYYRSQANASTADRFLDRLDSAQELISMFPEGALSLPERPGVHRLGLPRFPYCVFYEIIGDEVIILRVLHTARSPDDWSETHSA